MNVQPAPTPGVFRVATGVRILLTALFAPLIVACLLGPWWLLHDGSVDETGGLALWLVGLLLGLLLAGLLLAVHQSQIEIFSDGIRSVGAFGRTRELRFHEIEGFQIVDRRSGIIALKSNTPARKSIRIGQSLERRGELIRWIQSSFRNLDAEAFAADVSAMMSDVRLGGSIEERKATVTHARRATGWLQAITIAVFLWAFIFPQPYEVALAVLAIIPVVALIVVARFRGVVRLSARRGSPRPQVGFAVIGPPLGLMLRAVIDWRVLEWQNFWLPFTAVLAAAAAAVMFLAPDARTGIGPLLATVLFCGLYSFGVILPLNCRFDHSQAMIFATRVESRHVNHGKSTSYHLTLRPWVDRGGSKDVLVPRSIYDRHPEGSAAQVIVRDGVLGIRWYYVR